MEKKTLLYLPHELIILILIRLPVKSLIRFKCVCKSWFSIISESDFANSHFQLTSPTNTPRLMCISALSHEFQSIYFDAWIKDDSASLNLNISLPKNYFSFEIKGSCRGFIFLYRRRIICLWNPSTGFKKQIPVSPFHSKFIQDCSDRLYGFGYDHSRDDYVVVVMSHLADIVSSHLEFFSFRDNRWKEIEVNHFPYTNRWKVIEGNHYLSYTDGNREGEGVLFNGAIHWMVFLRGLDWDVIVAFDLMKRKLFEMHLPNGFDRRALIGFYRGAIVHYGLWVFGEYLSLWAKDNANDKVEIWVMKEYKVYSSWTKTLVLPLDAVPDRYFQPIYSTKNGDIIGRNDGTRLVKYNDKGQLLGNRSFSNSPSEVVMYTESLLSLLGDNEHER